MGKRVLSHYDFFMSKVFLYVDIDVKPRQREEFLSKLKVHANTVRGEKGCEFLDLYLEKDNPNKVFVWEIWSTREDWDVHMKNDASAAWQKVASPLVNGEQITVLAQA